MIDEKSSRQLDAGCIIHSFGRSRPRREIYLRLCEAYPGGMSLDEISIAAGYGKETIVGALIGNEGRYKPEDALITIGLATMCEEEHWGQKVTIFTATSNGQDVEDLLKDYAHNVGLLEKLKGYVHKLESKMWREGSKWKRQL